MWRTSERQDLLRGFKTDVTPAILTKNYRFR